MGRRHSGALPAMRLHRPSGNARVRLAVDGKPREVWLGPWGSPEAQLRYDAVVAAYLASGRRSIEGADVLGRHRPAKAAPAATPVEQADSQPVRPRPAAVEPVPGDLTIAELCLAWMNHIRDSRPDTYKRSSQWHGALAVTRALRPMATMPARLFGSRHLLEVRDSIARTPVVRFNKKGEPSAPKPRSRRYTNDTVAKVVGMFAWATPRGLVPEDRIAALQTVKPLRPGEMACVREAERREAVPDAVVEAVLGHLPPVAAAMVRFMRLTGCRPSEARLLRLEDIHDRDQPAWRYTPPRHKNAWRGQHRHIAIGPRAQAIVLDLAGRRSGSAYVFDPRLNVPAERANQGTIPIGRWSSKRAGEHYSDSAVRQAVQRAAEKAGVAHWFPYLLRYSRTQEVRRQDGAEAARATAGHKSDAMLAHYAPPEFESARMAALRSG